MSDPRARLDRDERAAGLTMIGTILFGTATGAGIGVFVEAPEVGAMVGTAVGIVAGLVVVPGLRDYRG
jgi:hypothetical protein